MRNRVVIASISDVPAWQCITRSYTRGRHPTIFRISNKTRKLLFDPPILVIYQTLTHGIYHQSFV